MADALERIQRLDDQCVEANIEENDYTIYSADDLSFDFGLLEQAMQKKSAFISNQVRTGPDTNPCLFLYSYANYGSLCP